MKTNWLMGLFLAAAVHAALPTNVLAEPLHAVETRAGILFAEPQGVPLLLDLHMPAGVENPPLVVWIHGGAWKAGSRNNSKIAWIAEHGYALASIEYRFSQEATFPAQIHDCKGAIRWLRAHADEYGYNAGRIVVAGSSAGGHLAALMGTSGGVEELEGDTGGNTGLSSMVQGVINYYGPTDFVFRSKALPGRTEKSSGSDYLLFGGKVSENLELALLASPITHLDAGDPPLLILHGAKDQAVLLEESERFRDACAEKGVEVELIVHREGGHGWEPPLEGERERILAVLEKWLGGVEIRAISCREGECLRKRAPAWLSLKRR